MLNKLDQINSHIELIKNIENNFSQIENDTAKQFTKIIDTAKSFQDKMLPINKNMSDLQILKHNIEVVQTEFQLVAQNRNLAKDVAEIIKNAKDFDLHYFLDTMLKISDAIKFFETKNFDHATLNELNDLFKTGKIHMMEKHNVLLDETFREADLYLDFDGDEPRLDEEIILRIFITKMPPLKQFLDKYKLMRIDDLNSAYQCYYEYRNRYLSDHFSRMLAVKLEDKSNFNSPQLNQKPKKIKPVKPKDANKKIYDVKDDISKLKSIALCKAILALPIIIKVELFWLQQLIQDSDQQMFILEKIFLDTITLIKMEISTLESKTVIKEATRLKYIKTYLSLIRAVITVSIDLNDILKQCPESRNTVGSSIGNLFTICYKYLIKFDYKEIDLPNDATIFESTANKLNELESVLDFGSMLGIIHSSLNEDFHSFNIQQLRHLAQTSREFTKKTQLDAEVRTGIFIQQEIESIIKSIHSISTNYDQKKLLCLISRINNIKYIIDKIEIQESFDDDEKNADEGKNLCLKMSTIYDYLVVLIEVLDVYRSDNQLKFFENIRHRIMNDSQKFRFLNLLRYIKPDLEEKQLILFQSENMPRYVNKIIELFLPQQSDHVEMIYRGKNVIVFDSMSLKEILQVAQSNILDVLARKLDEYKIDYIQNIRSSLSPWLGVEGLRAVCPQPSSNIGFLTTHVRRRQSTQGNKNLSVNGDLTLSGLTVTDVFRRGSLVAPNLRASRSSLTSNSSEAEQPIKIDSKEKAHLKQIWATFNQNFDNLQLAHKSINILDLRLRDDLKQSLVDMLVPAYKEFYEISLARKFTANPDKHVKPKPSTIEYRIQCLFTQSQNDNTRF